MNIRLKKKNKVLLINIQFLFGICFIIPLSSFANPLTLLETERLAVQRSPELQQLKAKSLSLREQSIADGQLSDPQLVAGAINVPTNSFSFTQDEMTMVSAGVQQAFPRGHTLAMKSKQTRALASAEQRKAQEQCALLLRTVRETWLDLHYWNEAIQIIKENQSLYRRLLKATESKYSLGTINQSDVLQVQVELSRLANQKLQIEQRVDLLRAQLGRYIGPKRANQPLVRTLPVWPNPPMRMVFEKRLQRHPLLEIDLANIKAARDEVALAKEQYKPGFMVGVDYGVRQGQMPNGMPRSDMLTAQVTIDLPIFPKNRQDRQVRASIYKLHASMLDRTLHYRDLLKELNAQYAIWTKFRARERIYQNQLLPEARQNAKAALLAYQSATTEMTTVLRAYSNALDIQLEMLQVRTEQMKARAALLYLEGVA